jgi:GNAT superfamily N-acetyltransferase
MPITIREAADDEIDALIPILLQAEPSRRALRYSLRSMSDAVYRLDVDGEPAGAATMRWRGEPCELIELAVAPERQGQGLGRRMIEWLVAEARRRGRRQLIVGTSSTSAGNILFYQKCGFRIDSVRRDYFWYYDEPRMENGLPVRDMIVFRYDTLP